MLRRTAISGPASGSRILCGGAVRMSLSPRYLRAPRRAVTLHVLKEGIVDLSGARANLALDALDREEVIARQCVRAFDEAATVSSERDIGMSAGAVQVWFT